MMGCTSTAALMLIALVAGASASSSVLTGAHANVPAFTSIPTVEFFTFGNQTFDGCIAKVAVAKPEEWCASGCPGPSDADVTGGAYRGTVVLWNLEAKVDCFVCDYAVWAVWVERVGGVGFLESLTGDPGYTPYFRPPRLLSLAPAKCC